MKKNNYKTLWAAVWLLAAFVIWTAAVCLVDVQPVGPNGSLVGFGALNRWFHELTGVHWDLYTLTDGLSLVPLGFVAGFAVLGLYQWCRRKSLWKVDLSILVLGGFYILVMAVFLLFEMVEINYRPVLIEGVLEGSYPSSTTMLVMCVMPTAFMQLCKRIRNQVLRRWCCGLIAAFTVFMVMARMISGVHWLTDIIGGGLLSGGLVLLYRAIENKFHD